MTPVFLDTVGLLAVWDVDDQWHGAAVPVDERIVRTGQTTVTTPLVLYECGNATSRGPFRANVDELRRLMAQEGQLIEPTPEEIESAWTDFVRGMAGSAGIVDHISFMVMRRLGLEQAFTNDKHFASAGFDVLF
jgi:uncharacterized protein